MKFPNIFFRAWNSPVITTWILNTLKFSKFFLLTPFILSVFTEVEIAAWYLFGTIVFFGDVVLVRVQLTFSRIVSFAFSGAKEFTPLISIREKRGDGTVNKKGVGEIYNSLEYILRFTAIIIPFVLAIIGVSSISNITKNLINNEIYFSFFFIIIIYSINIYYNKYYILLHGTNEITRLNRLEIFFTILSLIAAIIVLKVHGGFFAVTVVFQMFVITNILRNIILFENVFSEYEVKNQKYNPEIVKASLPPFWKGLLGSISDTGLIQLSGIILTKFVSAGEVASYLFSLKVMDIIYQIARVPITSRVPLFSKLLSEGNSDLIKILKKSMILTYFLFFIGVLMCIILAPILMRIIDSNINFLHIKYWLLLGFLYLLRGWQINDMVVCALGNHIVFYKRMFVIMSITLMLYFIYPIATVLDVILISLLPFILILNFGPLTEAVKTLDVNKWNYFRETILIPLLVYVLTLIIFLFYEY